MESQFDQFPKVHRTLCRDHDPSSFVLHLHVVLKSEKRDINLMTICCFAIIGHLDLDYEIGQPKLRF